MHEYRVRLDTGGKLFVNVDPGGVTGTAEWGRVTAADRITTYTTKQLDRRKWGDPDYVENVYRQPTL